jgi:hypothetical protein
MVMRVGESARRRSSFRTGIWMVFTVSAYFPQLGLLTVLLPEVEVRRKEER